MILHEPKLSSLPLKNKCGASHYSNFALILSFKENIECDFEFVTSSPAAMVSLIDKPAQQLLVSYTRI